MSSQPVAKTELQNDTHKDTTILAMEAFKATQVPAAKPTAANQDDDLDDIWDNMPV